MITRRSDTDDTLTTNVLILDAIDAVLVRPYLERELRTISGARVLPDVRINALIVTAPESRMPRLQAITTYLDDKRWYDPKNASVLSPKAKPLESLEHP